MRNQHRSKYGVVHLALTALFALFLLLSPPLPTTTATAHPAVTQYSGMVTQNGIPTFDLANFSDPTTIDNPYLPLVPGTQFTYVGFTVDDAGDEIPHTVVTTVTDLTKEICCELNALVVYEEDRSDGQLEEAEFYLLSLEQRAKQDRPERRRHG